MRTVTMDEVGGDRTSRLASPSADPRPLLFRPRLVAQVRAGMAGGLTLLSAPAGFGKSVLMKQWLVQHDGVPIVYASLRRGDDGGQVATRLVRALTASVADWSGLTTPDLHDDGSVLGSRFLDGMVEALAGMGEVVLI